MATIFRFGGWSSRFPREGEEKLFEQRIQINLETIPILFRVREKDERVFQNFARFKSDEQEVAERNERRGDVNFSKRRERK